jgi:pantothenate kinase
MTFPKSIVVTEQEIDISMLSPKQVEYYEALAQSLRQRFEASGKGRQIFTLSGPGGTGKSVVATILHHLLAPSMPFVHLGIDAFHKPNTILEETGLLGVKGRHDTYDVVSLAEKLVAFKAGDTVSFPAYSRASHNPVPDVFTVDTPDCLLFLEGQWLLSEQARWAELKPLFDYNYFVRGPAEDIKNNVIKRHITGGRTREDATDFYQASDMKNAHAVLQDWSKADEEILYYKKI